jgi:L-aminopeptidase/D-esterase-like protein
MLPNDAMDPLFEATVGATEEAIVNALVAGRTMKGRGGTEVSGLPHARLRAILARHGRLVEDAARP